MTNVEFENISKFEEIVELAKITVKDSSEPYKLNFSLKVDFDVNLVMTPQLYDVSTLAEEFQQVTKPEHLHLNHGEYITENGVNNVIQELKQKSQSNRAVISLINQDNIIGSGDVPIPSFMVLQFSLENNKDLYVTTYFRALEVSRFFRINLEEIRLIVKQIYDELINIKRVKLNVISFRAYINEQQGTLQKAEIDLIKEMHILTHMQKNPKKVISMLKEKKEESTIIDNKSLMHILDIISDSAVSDTIDSCFKGNLVKVKLESCISSSERLIDLRKKSSHGKQLEIENQKYLTSLDKFIEEVESCLYQ
ncbi:hypothetical protein [Exiguobacterium sp. HVEsp1]|uniref:hypothetical protein n=1 Tax=Exiguobacterium sp. HVEsp1 TaxID=1934003 RepID=UPI000990A226|nr:hypothetical protein [Exiguobacterium sp. HVEsp1]